MMRSLLAALLWLVFPALANAGMDVPPAPVDLSGYVRQSDLAATSTTFIPGFTRLSPGLTASLLTTSPCGASIVGQYAVVSDLYSSGTNTATNEVMRCGLTGTTYYWRPQRTDFTANVTTTGGTMTVSCLFSPPSIFLNGSLQTNATINLSVTYCWPGAKFEIANNLTLNLLGLTVTGLTGGVTKVMGASAHYTFEFDGTGWQFFQ